MPKAELRTPDSFEDSRLAIADFDGTTSQTFEKSPGGVDVDLAYEEAIESVLGPDKREQYEESGGLQNRAAIEVVEGLEPGASAGEIKELTERLVHVKLDILLGEIGTHFPEGGTWPRPMPGYIDFLKELENARQTGQPIDHLILSSGHEPFIKRTYESWDVQLPDHIIAEETLKALKMGHIYKPSPVLMDLAESMWRQNYGLNRRTPAGVNDRGRMKYIGDSIAMDGMLAANSGVDFTHVTPETSRKAWKEFGKRLDLGKIAVNKDAHETE